MNQPLDETPGNLDRDSDDRVHSYSEAIRFSGKGKGTIARTLKATSVLDKIKKTQSGMSPVMTDRIQTQEPIGGEPE